MIHELNSVRSRPIVLLDVTGRPAAIITDAPTNRKADKPPPRSSKTRCTDNVLCARCKQLRRNVAMREEKLKHLLTKHPPYRMR